jgi:Helix-turn-helix domain
MRTARREKVFGPGRAVPLDGNAKARIAAYARAWSGKNRQPGQHRGPITRAFLDVLEALLWGFHNARTGCCFPSYERIAEKAECARSTVAEALKALELAGVLTWQHRLTRIREACTDLFGRHGWRWRVIRTSNAYVLSDPKVAVSAGFASKSENPTGTPNQEIQDPLPASPADPTSPLERALARFGAAIEGRLLVSGSGGTVGAT